MPPGEELTRAVLYHQALLLVRDAQFDLAIAPLSSILQFQGPTAELEVACGLVLLRRPVLPQAVPAAPMPPSSRRPARPTAPASRDTRRPPCPASRP